MALCVLVVAAPAHAAGLDGMWRATVLKTGDQRVQLADYALVLSFDDKAKTWSAKTKTGDVEKTTEGTYEVDGSDVTLKSGGKPHPMRVIIQGNTLIISPKDDPNLRFVALRVK
jgi:hypothetical protein